jgi:hypothetical protein
MNNQRIENLCAAISEIDDTLIDDVLPPAPSQGETLIGVSNVKIVRVSWLQWAGLAAAFAVIITAAIFFLNFKPGDTPATGTTVHISTQYEQEPDTTQEQQSLIGTVRIMANGVEYEPFENISGMVSDGRVRCFTGLQHDEIAKQGLAPVVEYSDDFCVIVDGEFAHSWTYNIFSEDFEWIRGTDTSRPEEEFIMPVQDGVYYFAVFVTWQDGDVTSQNFRQYSAGYYIKLVIGDVSTGAAPVICTAITAGIHWVCGLVPMECFKEGCIGECCLRWSPECLYSKLWGGMK